MTTAERLAVLGRDPFALLAEVEETQTSAEDVLARWEDEALPADERARRLVAEHLRLVNLWCQLREPGLIGVQRLSTTPPMWLLIGSDSTARATSAQLAEWRYAKVKLWDATGQVPELVETALSGKPPVPIKWAKVLKALSHAAEAVDLGDLGTDTGQVREWINSYRAVRAGVEDDRPTDNAQRWPYRHGGHVHVFSTDLLHHLRTALGERINSKELRLLMHAAGAEHDKINLANIDGSPTSTTVYRLPRGWW